MTRPRRPNGHGPASPWFRLLDVVGARHGVSRARLLALTRDIHKEIAATVWRDGGLAINNFARFTVRTTKARRVALPGVPGLLVRMRSVKIRAADCWRRGR